MPEGSATLVTFARTRLLAAIEAARSSVWLASPFLSRPVSHRIAAAVGGCPRATDRRLLTALDPRSVQVGALDPRALRVLAAAGFEIRTIRNLHAKVSIVDTRWGLVGSGNLTGAGLGGNGSVPSAQNANVELGVVLSPRQVAQAARLYADWWVGAEPVSLETIARYEALPRFPRPHTSSLSRGPVLLPPADAVVADLTADSETRRYWMKAAYHRPGQDTQGWWKRGWISDRRPPPYAIGDRIVLYVGGQGSPHCCPAILEVRTLSREDADFVAANGGGDTDRRWPFVVRTTCLLDVPLESAPDPRDFSIDPRSTQPGYRGLSVEQFEAAVRTMVASSR